MSFTLSQCRAIRFFADHAGFATPPGRMACAKRLAAAERYAEEHGWEYRWEQDDVPWDGDGEHPREWLVCLLLDADGHVLDSLGGIADPTAEYGRVVKAELAAVAMPDYEAMLDDLAGTYATCPAGAD